MVEVIEIFVYIILINCFLSLNLCNFSAATFCMSKHKQGECLQNGDGLQVYSFGLIMVSTRINSTLEYFKDITRN